MPPSFADAFGHRQLVFDPTAGTSLEVLKFADLFSKSPEFETALRERTDALKHIHHPSLGTVHRVERDGEALLLLSKHTPGRRVAELQAKAQGPAFAADLHDGAIGEVRDNEAPVLFIRDQYATI